MISLEAILTKTRAKIRELNPHDPDADLRSTQVQALAAALVEEINGPDLCSLQREVADLRAWKESASAILDGINLQAVAQELEVGLGQDIGPRILPGIRALKAKRPLPRRSRA
jgi:hypothetical protein